MPLPPLLASRSAPLQALLAGVVPVAFGALTGVLLGTSEPLYLVCQVAAALGGFGGGIEHATARGGALRGLVGGSLFGAFILIAHEVAGDEAEAWVPEPAILLVAMTTVLGVALGMLGARARSRLERRGAGPD